MPRLVCINPWDKRIGPNRYLVELVRASPALARHTTIVLPEEGEAADEYRAIGCTVEIWREAQLVHMNAKPSNVWRLMRTHTLGVWHAIQRLRARRAQIVLTNSEIVWFAGIAARLLGLPHLQVFHGITLEYNWGKYSRLVRGYLRFVLLWNAHLIAVSQVVAQMLTRYGIAEEKIALVPNSLNIPATITASQQRLPDSLGTLICHHQPILVSFGRISPVKGHDLLIEAFAHVRAQYPNAGLFCAGAVLSNEGLDDTHSFYQGLQTRVHELGLDTAVHFLGEIDYALALLRRADVYVQPSRTESFCRAVAEAAVCRVPVVAFDVGGIPEVLGAEGGVLVPPTNSIALGEAILRVLNDAALRQRIVDAAFDRVTRHFDVQQIQPALIHLLNHLQSE